MGVLDAKVAIVTGAGRGIGRGIALELAREGAAVVVVSRSRASLDEVVDEITGRGGRALAVPCDIGFGEQIDAAVGEAVDAFGTVDVLVNNAQGWGTLERSAGGPVPHPLEDLPEDEWRWMFETGVTATLRFMQAVFPFMRTGGGRIINFGSRMGVVGWPGLAAYNCNKEAVRALTRTAAREWGVHGINVNTVNPSVETDAFRAFSGQDPAARDAALAQKPLKRWGTLADAGRLAVFLAGPDSSYLTGQTFHLDGGSTILP